MIRKAWTNQQLLLSVLKLFYFLAACLLFARALLGPFKLLISVNSALNLESGIAVSFVVFLCCDSAPRNIEEENRITANQQILSCFGLLAVTALFFWRTLDAPFVHDSYGHLQLASKATWDSILRLFVTRQTTGDLFFRPIGYLSYWLDYKWAGTDAVRWHAWNLAVHGLNTCLVYLLARKLSFHQLPAFITALVFSLHGSRPEVVSWMAARFDLLAALFVLLALFTFCRYLESKSAWWYVPLTAFGTLALLSKESAYCLPLLMVCIVPLPAPRLETRAVSDRFCNSTVWWPIRLPLLDCWWNRGYQTLDRHAAIAKFSLLRSAKALLYREWALLFFPINWSEDLDIWLKLSLLVGLAGLFVYMVRVHSRERAKILLAAAFVLAASLPVQHLLLLGSDLSGARILYLPVLGFALLTGSILESCRGIRQQLVVGCAIVIFQCAALEHNLKIWREVAFLAQRTCKNIGDELKRSPEPIEVVGLPAQLHGVFFLRNGVAGCVSINSGQSAERVSVNEDSKEPGNSRKRILRWNDQTERLDYLPSTQTQATRN